MGKIVNSHLMEYGYELLSAYPYAYHLSLQGQLDGTISGYDTKPLYFFSPNHTEVNERRAFLNIHQAKHDGIPNTIIHRAELDWDQMTFPPLKEHYKDKAITFSKPTVCICNRYTKEWGKAPINYFDIPTLEKLFNLLKDKYQIVYISVAGRPAYYDHHEEEEQDDYDFIYSNYDGSEVKIIHDIVEDREISFNEAVYKVFAGANKFVTMNGGYSILASYFGGENIIYCKESTDLIFNDFNRWYWRIGGSEITHINTYDKLISITDRLYLKEDKPNTYFILDDHRVRDKIKEIKLDDKDARIVVKTRHERESNAAKQYGCISSQYVDLMKSVYKKHIIL